MAKVNGHSGIWIRKRRRHFLLGARPPPTCLRQLCLYHLWLSRDSSLSSAAYRLRTGNVTRCKGAAKMCLNSELTREPQHTHACRMDSNTGSRILTNLFFGDSTCADRTNRRRAATLTTAAKKLEKFILTPKSLFQLLLKVTFVQLVCAFCAL